MINHLNFDEEIMESDCKAFSVFAGSLIGSAFITSTFGLDGLEHELAFISCAVGLMCAGACGLSMITSCAGREREVVRPDIEQGVPAVARLAQVHVQPGGRG